jgi:murein L,D-transpeptidase YcbB/YkuD
MHAIMGWRRILAALAVAAAGCGQPAGVVTGGGGIETRPDGARPSHDAGGAPDTGADAGGPALPDPGSPWLANGAPTEVGEVVLAWTDDAWHHGVTVPHRRAALTSDPSVAVARFEENLSVLLAALPMKPRSQAYVVDPEDGSYHSADDAWAGAADPATPELLAEATGLARNGDGKGLRALIDGRAPQLAGYRQLVDASKAYKKICDAGGWRALALFEGKQPDDAWREALAARLALEGFTEPPPVDPNAPPPKPPKPARRPRRSEGLPPSPPTPASVPNLEGIVTGYREARQLATKERFVDAELLSTLNVPCEDRLTTIHLNVRRWRNSLHAEVGSRIHVNLAAQELVFTIDGAERVRSRTVVGANKSFVDKKTKRRVFPNATPILSDNILKIIVNPVWNVPSRIARGEIDVEAAKDPEFLVKNHFRVITTASGGKMYVQESGDHNALGRLKLVFPNEEGVYMHDTPSKPKFRLPVRAASHGCVRVERVFELGAEILDRDGFDKRGKPFDVARLKALKGYQRPYPITLNTPVPVVFEYYTASVARVGEKDLVRFHPDIYAYDEGSREALAALGGVVTATGATGASAPTVTPAGDAPSVPAEPSP